MGRTLLPAAFELEFGVLTLVFWRAKRHAGNGIFHPPNKVKLQTHRTRVSPHRYGTSVVLLCGYHRDLGEVDGCAYIWPMALVLMMVVLAFGLLYVAVVAEERQMQEATKPRKR